MSRRSRDLERARVGVSGLLHVGTVPNETRGDRTRFAHTSVFQGCYEADTATESAVFTIADTRRMDND